MYVMLCYVIDLGVNGKRIYDFLFHDLLFLHCKTCAIVIGLLLTHLLTYLLIVRPLSTVEFFSVTTR